MNDAVMCPLIVRLAGIHRNYGAIWLTAGQAGDDRGAFMSQWWKCDLQMATPGEPGFRGPATGWPLPPRMVVTRLPIVIWNPRPKPV